MSKLPRHGLTHSSVAPCKLVSYSLTISVGSEPPTSRSTYVTHRLTSPPDPERPASSCQHQNSVQTKVYQEAKSAWSLTFPDRLKPLAERLYREALIHPFWAGQLPDEVRQSVEHRLWSYLEARKAPWWYGGCPVPKVREATPAQLEALKFAREARAAEAHERELRFNARLEAAQV